MTPVTAEVFKFIFISTRCLDSLSATKRIGKSHAMILARILYSYFAGPTKQLVFF